MYCCAKWLQSWYYKWQLVSALVVQIATCTWWKLEMNALSTTASDHYFVVYGSNQSTRIFQIITGKVLKGTINKLSRLKVLEIVVNMEWNLALGLPQSASWHWMLGCKNWTKVAVLLVPRKSNLANRHGQYPYPNCFTQVGTQKGKNSNGMSCWAWLFWLFGGWILSNLMGDIPT